MSKNYCIFLNKKSEYSKMFPNKRGHISKQKIKIGRKYSIYSHSYIKRANKKKLHFYIFVNKKMQ